MLPFFSPLFSVVELLRLPPIVIIMEQDNIGPLSVPSEEQLAARAEAHSNSGRPPTPQSVTDLLMHPSAMKFCDEATREKLLLIREFRRFNPKTGKLNATAETKEAIPKHPMFRTVSFLREFMNDPDLTPTARVTVASRIGAMMTSIEKIVQETQHGFVNSQMTMVRLIQQGSKKDLDDTALMEDVADKTLLEDEALIEEAKSLGLGGSALEKFLTDQQYNTESPDEEDNDS
jgi:hypothetical protein